MRAAADAVGHEMRPARPRSAAPRVVVAAAIGLVIGVTWAAGLRAYMVALVGSASAFSWSTLLSILLPGAIAGACVGAALALHERGARRAWLLGFSPFAFTVLTLAEPGALVALLTQGLGGGAIAVPAALVLGGFGFGSAGPRAVRVGCLTVALLIAAGVVATVPIIGGPGLELSTPRGVWAAALAGGLLVSGMLGTVLAFRPSQHRR